MSDELIDEVVNQHKDDTEGGHVATEATTDHVESVALADAVADAFGKIDDTEDSANEHLSMRDRNLSALFQGLEDADRLTALGEQAAGALEKDTTPETQSEVLRLLLRYALADLDDEILEAGTEGRTAYEKAQVEDTAASDF